MQISTDPRDWSQTLARYRTTKRGMVGPTGAVFYSYQHERKLQLENGSDVTRDQKQEFEEKLRKMKELRSKSVRHRNDKRPGAVLTDQFVAVPTMASLMHRKTISIESGKQIALEDYAAATSATQPSTSGGGGSSNTLVSTAKESDVNRDILLVTGDPAALQGLSEEQRHLARQRRNVLLHQLWSSSGAQHQMPGVGLQLGTSRPTLNGVLVDDKRFFRREQFPAFPARGAAR